MILSYVIGALGAGGLGWLMLRSHWGFCWGAAVYLVAPATMALSLQDYQDLCMALPCLMLAMFCFRSGRWWLAPLGAVLAIAPREETIPMAVACAFLMPPVKQWQPGVSLDWRAGLRNLRWLAWLRNIVLAIGIGAVYVWWAEKNFPINSGGHDMPLENAMGSLKHQRIFMEGWVYGLRFYSLVFVPLGVLAVLAPMVAAPAVALVLLHMPVPDGHGVDRRGAVTATTWHRPGLALAGVIIGGGRLMRWLSDVRLKWLRFVLPAAIMAGTIGYGGWWWGQWSSYNLRTGWTMQEPEWEHPGWRLMAQLPEGAVPVVSKNTALLASSYRTSYTLDESLLDKAGRKGLSAATHAIIDRRRTDALARIMVMSGAEELASDGPFVLLTWDPKARDPMAASRERQAATYVGQFGAPMTWPAWHHEAKSATMGSFPVINLEQWRIGSFDDRGVSRRVHELDAATKTPLARAQAGSAALCSGVGAGERVERAVWALWCAPLCHPLQPSRTAHCAGWSRERRPGHRWGHSQ